MSWLWTWLTRFLNPTNPYSGLVVKIQALVVKLCGFLPTAETVLALVAVNPGVTVALVVAKKICAAVTAFKPTPALIKAGLSGGETPKPTVDGIVIEGEWVDPKKEKK